MSVFSTLNKEYAISAAENGIAGNMTCVAVFLDMKRGVVCSHFYPSFFMHLLPLHILSQVHILNLPIAGNCYPILVAFDQCADEGTIDLALEKLNKTLSLSEG